MLVGTDGLVPSPHYVSRDFHNVKCLRMRCGILWRRTVERARSWAPEIAMRCSLRRLFEQAAVKLLAIVPITSHFSFPLVRHAGEHALRSIWQPIAADVRTAASAWSGE